MRFSYGAMPQTSRIRLRTNLVRVEILWVQRGHEKRMGGRTAAQVPGQKRCELPGRPPRHRRQP